jgi:hypothetical protein
LSEPASSWRLEIRDGENAVAAAEVTKEHGSETARASLHAAPGHITPGSRASLVDAVMDMPEVRESTRLEAAVPLGDGESLERLRERTDDTTTRSAGSSALLDASIRHDAAPAPAGAGEKPDGEPAPGEDPAGEQAR